MSETAAILLVHGHVRVDIVFISLLLHLLWSFLKYHSILWSASVTRNAHEQGTAITTLYMQCTVLNTTHKVVQ